MDEIKKELCKYEFSEEEKRELAMEMAKTVGELDQKTLEKKAIMSDLKSQIDSLDAQVKSLASKLNTGYEHRNMNCRVERDVPSRTVYYYRVDTDKLVKTRPMTQDELQSTIPGM
jgi:predicted phage-related endonuclease